MISALPRSWSTKQLAASKNLLLLLGIFAFGMILRVVHWSPSADGDEARYINHAFALAHGRVPEYFDPAVAVRIPYLLFLAAWGSVFGLSTPVLQASGFLTYFLTSFLLWKITKGLFGPTAALISIFLLASIPIHVVLTTHALTDDLGTASALASFLIWHHAFARETQDFRFWCLVAVSGFLGGLSTGIRQPFFLLGIILPLGTALARGYSARLGVAAVVYAGLAFVYFVLEALAFKLWLGNFLFRLTQDLRLPGTNDVCPAENGCQSFLQELSQFVYYFPHLLPSGPFVFLPSLLALAIVELVRRGPRVALPGALFVIGFVSYHFWGTTSLWRWSPPPVNARYLLPPMLMGCALVGGWLARMYRRNRFAPCTVFLAGLVWLAAGMWHIAYDSRPNCVTEFARFLSAIPNPERGQIVIPESVKRYFLPYDYWVYINGFKVVPDAALAEIESLDLSAVMAVAVPNQNFYRYRHVGVWDAFHRTASWWRKEEVIGEKWPRYLKLTGKPSGRVIGFMFFKIKKDHSPAGPPL